MNSDKHKYSLKSVKAMLIVVILLACLTAYMDSQMQKQGQSEAEALKIAQQMEEQLKLKEQKEKEEQEKLELEKQQEALAQAQAQQMNQENMQGFEEAQEYQNNYEYAPQQEQQYDETQNNQNFSEIDNLRQEAAIEAQNGNLARAVEIYADIYRTTNSKTDLIILGEVSISANMKKPFRSLLKAYLTENPQDIEEMKKYRKFIAK